MWERAGLLTGQEWFHSTVTQHVGKKWNHLFGLIIVCIYKLGYICFHHFGLHFLGTAHRIGLSIFPLMERKKLRGVTIAKLICKPFLVLILLTFDSWEGFSLPSLFLIDFVTFVSFSVIISLDQTASGFIAKSCKEEWFQDAEHICRSFFWRWCWIKKVSCPDFRLTSWSNLKQQVHLWPLSQSIFDVASVTRC